MADLVQRLKEREELLVSSIMIAHDGNEYWSELLSSVHGIDVSRSRSEERKKNVSNPVQNRGPQAVMVL